MKEREAWRVEEDTSSVWSLLHEGNPDILNYLYQPPVKGQLKVSSVYAKIVTCILRCCALDDQLFRVVLVPSIFVKLQHS